MIRKHYDILHTRLCCAAVWRGRRYNCKLEGTLYLQNEMIFLKVKKPFGAHFSKLQRQAAALNAKIIRKLLPGKRDVKFVFSAPLGFGG